MSLSAIRDLCIASGRLHEHGQAGEARRLAAQAVADCRSALGVDHYAFPLCLTTLGWVSPPGAAGPLFAEAATRARVLAKTDHEHAATALTHVRNFYTTQAEGATALAVQRELVALYRDHLGGDHPRYFAARAELERLAADQP